MKFKKLLSLTLGLSLLLGCGLTACGGNTSEPTSTQGTENVTSVPVVTDTPVTPGTEAPTDSNGTDPQEPPVTEPTLTGPYADTIMLSNRLANGVQASYADPLRSAYRIANQSMALHYSLSGDQKLITSLTNKAGKVYLENTMDTFITLQNGKTYYASNSTSAPHANIYRLGYYYYDAHIMGQNFFGDASIIDEMPFRIVKSTVKSHQVKDLSVKDGVITYVVDGGDPYVYTPNAPGKTDLSFSAEDYNAVQFSVKANCTEGYLYFIAGGETGHTAKFSLRFEIIGNGDWNTYTLILDTLPDYTGDVTSLRFDIGNSGDMVQIKDIKAVKLNSEAPPVLLDRTFHTYSDKMNQVLHFVPTKEVTNIARLGCVTEIPADTVSKLIIKDKNGLHDSLSGVDFATAEYVAFDIKEAGILGLILLPHENSGTLEVTLANGVYTIIQAAVPEGGKLSADLTSTADDFYMGHRLYTDSTHSFDTFLREADYERHPLETLEGESYLGYDVLRGAYKYSIGGSADFNLPFFSQQNYHYTADVSVKGGDTDRDIYVYTYYEGGCGENALILDQNDMLLPIPVMIYKNFKGENEEPVFDPGDASYSEAYFPISVKAGSETQLTVLNLYMNWGQFPLKQLSSIQFFWPYYHLSLGVTETSCICPMYSAKDLWTLPDFRSLSMPYWYELPTDQGYDNQPQHTHAGFQYFLQYTDAEGHYAASENYQNTVISSGPIYTDVKMDYISDDGRIKVSYNHLEMPETDELRAYYEINYEVLEDINFSDFAKDFSFYSLEGHYGEYRKMGYLAEGNKIVHKDTNRSSEPEVLKLGTEAPYLALYDLDTTHASSVGNNANLGFVIADSDMTIGGQPCNASFVAVGQKAKYSLSLDLGSVTLKKGDTMKLCIIICPWGFYTSTDDSNIQQLRENTCLDPLRMTVQDGEALESVYLPKVKSTNGTSAEFTFTGSSNNKSVRVYGFNKLTAPVVYEKIDGKWVELVLNSSQTPDKKGNFHYYDGYAVYYDRDGTYSYAFAFNMDGVESRSFRIVADKDFTPWPEIEQKPADRVNVCIQPGDIALAAQGANGIGSLITAEDGSYVRIHGKGDSTPEAYFQLYSYDGITPSGQYMVIKYRLPADIKDVVDFEFFTSTVNAEAVGGESFFIRQLVADGEWHIAVADLSKQGLPTFKANADGVYSAKHIRFDIYNSPVSADTYVDIGYILLSPDLNDICEFIGEGTGDVYERGSVSGSIDFSNNTSEEGEKLPTPEELVDPASGFHLSDVRYKAMIDFINGHGDGEGPYDGRGTNSDIPLDFIAYQNGTAEGQKLAFAGWAVAQGGIKSYMWSADNGKTWQECSVLNMVGLADITTSSGILEAANGFFAAAGYEASDHPQNVVFQSLEGYPSGVCADLSAYTGQTLDVIFALVPEADPQGLCLIAVIQDVLVQD